jgi:hypothetical protein
LVPDDLAADGRAISAGRLKTDCSLRGRFSVDGNFSLDRKSSAAATLADHRDADALWPYERG